MALERIVSAESAGLGRVVFARLAPGEDLMEGIRFVCRKHGLRNGAILTCIGSLEKVTFGFAVLTRDPEAKKGAPKHWSPEGAVSLLGAQGIICGTDAVDGRDLSIHLHGSVQDNTGKVLGQHIEDIPGANRCFNTVELVIADLGGIELVHRPAPELDGPINTVADEA